MGGKGGIISLLKNNIPLLHAQDLTRPGPRARRIYLISISPCVFLRRPRFVPPQGGTFRLGACLPVSFLSFSPPLIQSPVVGAVPAGHGIAVRRGFASIRVRGSTTPACGLWPSALRTIHVCSYGFHPVEVVRSGCWRLFPMGGTSHQKLAPPNGLTSEVIDVRISTEPRNVPFTRCWVVVARYVRDQ